MPSLSSAFEPAAGIQPAEEELTPEALGDRGQWSYRVALLFLALYYIRPQDWVPGMAGFSVIRPVIFMWAAVMLAGGLTSPLRGFFRTPHDWAMLVFYGYVVWNAPPQADAAMGMFSLVIFFYLTTQALSSWDKLLGYARMWTWMLIIVALFGVLQTMGLDITGGKDITEYGLGRLALGTWTCNNANALGHTVVAALPLSYLMLFWRSSAFSRVVLFPIAVALIVICAWETQSKGSFLVGAGLSVLIFVVGRPKWMQILVLSMAMTAGVGSLNFMPRMESMGDLRADEGVLGRIMAWENAYRAMQRNETGAGWRQFESWITFVDEGGRLVTESKSTHSSYVQVGADLGKPGIYLWLLVLLCTFRGVAFYKTENDMQERCRRAILLILIGYLASGWMINREYHTEFYLVAALGAAFHRLTTAAAMRAASRPASATEEKPEENPAPPWALPSYDKVDWINPVTGPPVTRKLWTRFDWVDFVAAAMGTWIVLYIWEAVRAII